MGGFETGLTGGIAILLFLVVGLVFVLYLVPIPLWIAAGPAIVRVIAGEAR